MKRVVVFLLAVGLGTLAVRGQDAGRKESLRAQIDKLNRMLRARLAETPAEAKGEVGLRIYEVGDLCMRIGNIRMSESNLIPSKYQPVEPPEEEDATAPFEIDQLIEMIQVSVAPASWDEIEGARIEVRTNRLFVTTLPRIHERIGRFLAWSRAQRDRQISVEVVAVPVEENDVELLAGQPRDLTAAQAAALLARKSYGRARLNCWDGQRMSQEHGREISYLQDYDVEIARDSKVGDPIRQTVFEGFAIEVQAGLDPSGGGVVLHCRFQLTDVSDPIVTHATEHGDVELPTMDLTRLNTSFWAPLGKTVVAGGCTAGNKPCILLVTARRLKAAR